MVGIIQGNGHIGKALWLSDLRSREDNILHGSASQLLCALLTEHPAHRVGNIALAASVRPYNTGNSVVELKQDLVGKGFESLYLNAL